MSTRRKFLLKGSVATTSLMLSQSFKSIANTLFPLTGFTVQNNKLVLLHTGNNMGMQYKQTLSTIGAMKSSIGNVAVFHSGNEVVDATALPHYDATLHEVNESPSPFRIVYKGSIKIGVVSLGTFSSVSATELNQLAGYLKKEKNCHLVVCLSSLGYKSSNAQNNLTLAAQSEHVDVIVSGHQQDFAKHPVIALNKNNEEVIINHAAANNLGLGNIEIEFDNKGNKKGIAFG